MISIFTPTYNRAKLLAVLKDSIDAQTDKDFEWIIVDDGSTDDTEKIVKTWLGQKRSYSLRYVRQKNQGKHIAFNTALRQAVSEWFICVDSDDHLTNDAVAIMNDDTKKTKKECVGVVYPSKLTGFHNEKKWESIDNIKVDIMDLKVEYNIPESVILMKKSEISDLKFPQIKGEKFIPEGWLYQKLIKKGKFLVHNKAFYIAEYQPNGLTRNVWNLWAKNSTGVLVTLCEKYRMLEKYPLKTRAVEKIKCIININTICMEARKNILAESPAPLFSIVLMIPSLYYHKKRFGQEHK